MFYLTDREHHRAPRVQLLHLQPGGGPGRDQAGAQDGRGECPVGELHGPRLPAPPQGPAGGLSGGRLGRHHPGQGITQVGSPRPRGLSPGRGQVSPGLSDRQDRGAQSDSLLLHSV